MATFAELWRSVAPGALPIGRLDAAWDAEVNWVRILKARVPAFDALEAGDLTIVPASAVAVVAPGPDELHALVEALVRAPVAGVFIVRGDAGAASDAMAEALASVGLPAVRVEGDEAAGLERSAIGYLVNRRAELERQAAELERQLERLALVGRGLDAFAAAIGAFAGRAVVIERRRGDPLAIHAPADRPAAAAAVVAYHARPADVSLRVPLPGPAGRPAGALVLLGDGSVGERERVACERVATLLALELTRAGGPAAAAPGGGSRETLPAAGPPWVVYVARQAMSLPDHAELPGAPPSPDLIAFRESVRSQVRALCGPDRLLLRGDAQSLELRAIAAAPVDDSEGLELARRIRPLVGGTVAVSRPFREPSGRPVAEAEARTTLEAAERVADPPAVAPADHLPAYRLLGAIPDLPDGARQARALLEPLLVGSELTQTRRLETLRAILDRDAAGEAASILGVHRNTITYRLRRIEELGGWDLRDPELRLALAIAVRIVQSAQVGGPTR